jgi:hypothetical protein
VLAIDIMFQHEGSHDIAGYASTLHFLSTVTLSDPGEIRYSVGFDSVMFVLLGVDAQVPPALKRVMRVESRSRSAEALLPPHKCGGSHQMDKLDSGFVDERIRRRSCS